MTLKLSDPSSSPFASRSFISSSRMGEWAKVETNQRFRYSNLKTWLSSTYVQKRALEMVESSRDPNMLTKIQELSRQVEALLYVLVNFGLVRTSWKQFYVFPFFEMWIFRFLILLVRHKIGTECPLSQSRWCFFLKIKSLCPEHFDVVLGSFVFLLCTVHLTVFLQSYFQPSVVRSQEPSSLQLATGVRLKALPFYTVHGVLVPPTILGTQGAGRFKESSCLAPNWDFFLADSKRPPFSSCSPANRRPTLPQTGTSAKAARWSTPIR